MKPPEQIRRGSGHDALAEGWFLSAYGFALLLALVLIFAQFVFSNKLMLGYDILSFGLWQRDLLKSFLTVYHTIPLWNPYILCGLPYVEAIHGGVFYPLSYLDFLGYVPRMIGFNFLVHFWLAGIFAYLAARQFKLSRVSAVTVGAAYALSPLVLSWIGPGHDGKIYCAAYFPLVMLYLDRIFERKGFTPVILLGIVFGIIILTPHLQMAYYIAWCIAGFTIYKSLEQLREKAERWPVLKRIGKVGLAVALGLAISAVQWLPSSKYIVESSPRSLEQRGYQFAEGFSLHLEELIAVALPDFCGIDHLPSDRTYWGHNPFRDNSDSAGPITIMLAAIGLACTRWRQKFWWLISAAIAIIYSLGATTPLFRPIVAVVPLLDSMRAPATSMFIALFSLAMLAGYGLQSIRDGQWQARERLARILRFFLWGLPILALVAALIATVAGESLLHLYARIFYPSLLVPPLNESQWPHALKNLPWLQMGLWLAALFTAATSWVIFAVRKRSQTSRLLFVPALLIVLANGIFLQRCLALEESIAKYDPSPVSAYLAQHAGNDRALLAGSEQNLARIGWYPVQSEVGYHSRPLLSYYQLIGGQGCPNFRDGRLIDLTGTKYIVGLSHGAPPDLGTDEPLATEAVFGGFAVFANPGAFPRTFMVDRYKVGPNLKAIDDEVLSGKTDLLHQAILEEKTTLPILPAQDSSAQAQIVFYSPDSVEISVTCKSNQLLILTDNYYENWHAYVDGVEHRIYRAYGSFRAVEIPAKSTRVVFRYHSGLFQTGKSLSFAGLFVVACYFAYTGMERRRKLRSAASKAKAASG